MANILILGADGFIGSNLSEALANNKNHTIRVFDQFKNGISRNLEHLRDRLEFYSGDFLNKNDLKESLKGIEYVFHFISLTTPGSSMHDPLFDIETNVRGTLLLLDECVQQKVKKVIFASSGGAIYGDQDKEILTEDDIAKPISPYAISKLTIEHYLHYYKANHGLDCLILRYSNVYGPRQNIAGNQGIIPIFLNLVKQGKAITIFGDGENIRDYIFIADAVNITTTIFEQETKHCVYNVGSGENATINQVVEAIKLVTKKNVDIKKMPNRSVDVRKAILDISRIKNEFGFQPKISLEDGIRKTWEWLNQ